MFTTTTGITLQFFINGIEIPLDITNVESMLIVNNIYDNLPTLRITIIDDKNLFNSIQLFDGVKFSVLIGNKQDTKERKKDKDELSYELTFSLLSIPEYFVKTNSTKITLYGIYNQLSLWKERKPLSLSGSSNEVIAYIMKMNDIPYLGVKTYDSMTWHNFGKSQIDFIKDIVKHSYIRDGSCMLSYFNYNGYYKLSNVNAFKKPDFYLNNILEASDNRNRDDEKTYYYTDISYKYQSGINDFTYSYKNKSYQYSFMRSDKATELDLKNKNEKYRSKENSLIPLNDMYGKAFNLNEADYSTFDRINIGIDPINVGNVHQNWSKALYQNTRYKSLFNIYCEVYLPEITSIDVGNMVSIQFNSASKELKDIFGFENWFVEAKTLAVSVNQYTEKLLLSTTGFSNNLWEKTTRNGFLYTKDGGVYA